MAWLLQLMPLAPRFTSSAVDPQSLGEVFTGLPFTFGALTMPTPALFSFSLGMTPEAQWALVMSAAGVEPEPSIELQQEPLPAKPTKRRAKHPDGKFVADDAARPEVDEAWVEEGEAGKTDATEEQA